MEEEEEVDEQQPTKITIRSPGVLRLLCFEQVKTNSFLLVSFQIL